MRFTELSQEATQQLWDTWKSAIREILDEFNEDVFHGNGTVSENAYNERPHLLLETKKEFLYVFPMPGDLLFLGVYRHIIPKEHLNLKYTADKPDEENIIGWHGLELGILESLYGEDKDRLQYYLEKVLKTLHRKYWVKLAG